MFTALLDTNVLWPGLQRDFLLSLATEGIYRATWSEVILDELEYELKRKSLDKLGWTEEQAHAYAHRLRSEMERSFPDALVRGWEALEGTYGLPDPGDEHVLAAAVIANAGVIVTSNLKDFPRKKLPGALVALTPQEFVEDAVDLAPGKVHVALARMAARSGRLGPKQTPEEIAAELASRYEMVTVPSVLV